MPLKAGKNLDVYRSVYDLLIEHDSTTTGPSLMVLDTSDELYDLLSPDKIVLSSYVELSGGKVMIKIGVVQPVL